MLMSVISTHYGLSRISVGHYSDAPFCSHPDRAPAPSNPTHGPTDGFGLGCGFTAKSYVRSDLWINERWFNIEYLLFMEWD